MRDCAAARVFPSSRSKDATTYGRWRLSNKSRVGNRRQLRSVTATNALCSRGTSSGPSDSAGSWNLAKNAAAECTAAELDSDAARGLCSEANDRRRDGLGGFPPPLPAPPPNPNINLAPGASLARLCLPRPRRAAPTTARRGDAVVSAAAVDVYVDVDVAEVGRAEVVFDTGFGVAGGGRAGDRSVGGTAAALSSVGIVTDTRGRIPTGSKQTSP